MNYMNNIDKATTAKQEALTTKGKPDFAFDDSCVVVSMEGAILVGTKWKASGKTLARDLEHPERTLRMNREL